MQKKQHETLTEIRVKAGKIILHSSGSDEQGRLAEEQR